jgi:hypothetical protein
MPRAVRAAAAVPAARRTHVETPCLGCSSCLASRGSLVLAAMRLEADATQAGCPAAGKGSADAADAAAVAARGASAGGGAEAIGAEQALSSGTFVSCGLAGGLWPGGPYRHRPYLAAALGAAGRLAHDRAGSGSGDGGDTEGGGGGGCGPGPAGSAACAFCTQQPACQRGLQASGVCRTTRHCICAPRSLIPCSPLKFSN